MFVGNEVALHRVAGEVIRRILAGEPLDTRSVAMAAAAADLSPQGIRNEIAQWVSAQRVRPEQAAALAQLARAMQAALTVDVNDPRAVRLVAAQQVAAVACLAQRGVQLVAGQDATTALARLTADTPARVDAFEAFAAATRGLDPAGALAGEVACEVRPEP